VTNRSTSLKITLTAMYSIIYLALFTPGAEHPLIIFLIGCITSMCLWFGPIAVIGSNNNVRKFYDPATLFNLGVFYYTIKGTTLAWGIRPSYIRFISIDYAVEVFPLIALYMFLGIISWNLAYQFILRDVGMDVQATPQRNVSPPALYIFKLWPSILFLALLGIVAVIILFVSVGADPLFFIRSSWKRGYLSTNISGVGSGLASMAYYLMHMLQAAAILWLVNDGWVKRTLQLSWVVFSGFVLVILFLVAARAVILGYLISLLFVYHFLFRPLNPRLLMGVGLVGGIYSYAINIWRGISNQLINEPLSTALSALAEEVNFRGFMEFISSGALVDIHVFPLIVRVYGDILPHKYGETLLRMFYQFIPRSLWANKPLDLGIELDRLARPNSITGFPPGFFPEMYMNFNIFGIVLGGAVLGIVLAYAYRFWILSTRRSPLTITLYAILISRIFLISSNTFGTAFMLVAIPMGGAIIAVKVFGRIELQAPSSTMLYGLIKKNSFSPRKIYNPQS